jgi:hypothetical protein
MTPDSTPSTTQRIKRRERLFKRLIVVATMLILAGMIAGTRVGRYYTELWAGQARDVLAQRLFGLEPDRARVEAEWQLRRQRGIEETHRSLSGFFNETTDEMRELFRVAGMDPDHALVRYGRAEQAFVISSQVFEPDQHGRSYRFRPNTRSVWLRQITIRNGPFSMFQVLDTPEHRATAARAGGIVDEGSIQNTNSWGLRGPEPDPTAPVRGIVLGDSFMQAMFNGDADTPPLLLERHLHDTWKLPVSILNTGHIGYSPEQYYYSLEAFGDRFRPQFVVVSVCPNDFGDGNAVMRGQADWLREAEYWLERIQQWCRARTALCLVVPVPVHQQVETTRRDAIYPGQVCEIVHTQSARYCFPIDEFIDEHLKLVKLADKEGRSRERSMLYNRQIDDDHFSPRGAALWAEIVGRRLVRLFDLAPGASQPAGTKDNPLNAPASPSPR